MIWTLSKIAEICSGQLHGVDRQVEFFITDSRRIHLGNRSLFIAMKGNRNDGHHHIESAIEQGVNSLLIDDASYVLQEVGASYVLVEDALDAFQKVASSHRSSFSYPVLSISGSYGKTQVKELLTKVLATKFNVIRSPRSYNSQTGVPLSIMAMEGHHSLAIIEAGISRPGEMERLEKIIQPDIGIFTSLGPAHQDGFLSEEQKLDEKLNLFERSGILVFPEDETLVNSKIKARFGQGNTMLAGWGHSESSFLHIISVDIIDDQQVLSYCTGGKSHTITLDYESEEEFKNLITTLTTLHILGLEQDEIRSVIGKISRYGNDAEFIQSPYGRGLMVDIGQVKAQTIRTAKEQLRSLTGAQDLTVILCETEGSQLANDKRVQELAEELSSCTVLCVGTSWHALKDSLDSSKIYASSGELKEDLASVINPEHVLLLQGEWSPEFLSLRMMLEEKSHQTTLFINLTSLIHNLNLYRDIVSSNTKVMAMVKAFAYGSGEAEVARTLEFHKVDYLTVAYADEGTALRRAGIEVPIMVMNSNLTEFKLVVEHKLEPEIFSLDMLKSFVDFSMKEGVEHYPIHLKFDTGMHRLGMLPEQVEEVVEIIKRQSAVQVRSVFSHLYASDASSLAQANEQVEIFEQLKAQLSEVFGGQVLFHILNSAGISRMPQAHYDMVRLGIGLYGFSGDDQMNQKLLPVLSWQTSISQIKHVDAGKTVGYGGLNQLDEAKQVATIPVGYADGLSRILGNGNGAVVIKGKRCPFIGNICMDMSLVDVSGVACSQGDPVEIIGPNISITDLAEQMGTIPYEVLTSIPPRVKRRYIFTG